MNNSLVDAIADVHEDEALCITQELLSAGADPTSILDDCRKGMLVVGKRFEQEEYFLPELVMAGEILKQISDVVKPHMLGSLEGGREKLGKVLVGTVEGDVHDIGKNIVTFMLDLNDIEVRDIGIDVPPATFVNEIRQFQPDIVGLSGFLTVAFDSMKATVDAISSAGLRDDVRIMIGGGPIDETVLRMTGADAYGKDAVEAVDLAKRWLGAD